MSHEYTEINCFLYVLGQFVKPLVFLELDRRVLGGFSVWVNKVSSSFKS